MANPGNSFTGGVNPSQYGAGGPTSGNGYQNWYNPSLGGMWGDAMPLWQQFRSFGPVQQSQPPQENPPLGAPGPVSGGKGMQQPNQMNNQNMGYRHAA